jgi:beta-lactamase class A
MRLSTPFLAVILALTVYLSVAQKTKNTATTPPPPAFTVPIRLEQELLRLSGISGGKVGIWATHIESGKTISQNGKERFPMASAYKVAISTQLFMRIDSELVRLEQLVELTKDDLHPGIWLA